MRKRECAQAHELQAAPAVAHLRCALRRERIRRRVDGIACRPIFGYCDIKEQLRAGIFIDNSQIFYVWGKRGIDEFRAITPTWFTFDVLQLNVIVN